MKIQVSPVKYWSLSHTDATQRCVAHKSKGTKTHTGIYHTYLWAGDTAWFNLSPVVEALVGQLKIRPVYRRVCMTMGGPLARPRN